MATETERKFLVKGDYKKFAVKAINIIQGYLIVDPAKTIRVRITDDEAFLTIKSPRKDRVLSRGEWEFRIPVNDAVDLLEISLPGRVIKTRYIIPAGDFKYEVDEFHDKNEGLVVAEIELRSEEDVFEKPDWLGEEVTGDPRYYSSMLIK